LITGYIYGRSDSPTTNLPKAEEAVETDNVLYPDTNQYPTEISYPKRSSFLDALKEEINRKKQALLSGAKIECYLGQKGGYKAQLTLYITYHSTVFCTDWVSTDLSRFPARIKAMALALYELNLNGIFEVNHQNGVITVKLLNPKSDDIAVQSNMKISNNGELQVFPARIFRIKKELVGYVKAIPGIYKWWFPKAIAMQLNIPIDGCVQNNEGKLLLYVGISGNLRKRLDWHINQKHRSSSIKAGTISTFRHSLCSLLSSTLEQEAPLNRLIDQLDVSFEYTDTKNTALLAEEVLMSKNIIPLNIQGNKHQFTPVLKKLRAQCRLRSLELI
jgi:hypothetical protein